MRALCLASIVAVLALAPAAGAQQVGLISDGAGTAVADFSDTPDDGSRVVFQTADPLLASDTDTVVDVYVREPDGALTHLSDGPAAADPDTPTGFTEISRDGTRVFFHTSERLLPSDTDGTTDAYEVGPDGLRHLTDDPTGADDNIGATVLGHSSDGTRVFFITTESLSLGDTDTQLDVYEGGAGGVTLVSDDDAPGIDAEVSAGFSGDGTRAFFQTREPLAPSDTDNAQDVYERTPSGQLVHLSDGSGADLDLAATFNSSSRDGGHVFLLSNERLLPGDEDDARDAYQRTPSGELVHVSDGPGPDADLPVLSVRESDDATRVFFTTAERLAASDTDDASDVYERGLGGPRHVSDGPVEPDANVPVFFTETSSDATRLFFETADPLLPGDDDAVADVYERGPAGAYALVSDAAGPDAALPADFRHASRDGARVTFETAEALAPGDTDAALDVYQRTPAGVLLHFSDTQLGPDAELAAAFVGASEDGRRVFIESDERLTPDDADSQQDVYAVTLPPAPPPEGPGPEPPPGGGDPPPGGGPTPDTTRPRVSRARLARRRFAGRTELRFTLSEPATVRLGIERALPGRRVGRSCRATSRANRGRRRCTRYVAAGRRTIRARAGANVIRLRAGRPGGYRLTLTAVDAAGNVSRRARLPFTVVRARRR
jgi:hypothetical protein